MSKKASSFVRRLVCPERTISQLFKLLFPLTLLMSPKRSCWRERKRRGESCGRSEGTKWNRRCERDRGGTEADVEDEDEDVDVVGGFDEVGVSGYESEGFTLSEILRRKRLEKKNVSEGVVDTAHFPQCEFSNLQHLPLALLLEFLCWSVIEFY